MIVHFSSKHTLYVISAPSGAGKTTLLQALIKAEQQLQFSISHTTRPKRENEKEGSSYYFINKNEFIGMLDANLFIEHAEVFGNLYGTSKESIKKHLIRTDVILDIDWQGMLQVKKLYNNVVTIFILPPSIDALKERLTSRGQDKKLVIERRMEKALKEIKQAYKYDYILVNDNFNYALEQLRNIVLSERLRLKYNTSLIDNFYC